jgi:hypothetical protein
VQPAVLLRVMAGRVMLLEQVLAEVAAQVAPDRVDVIGVVLRVVQLDQERRGLNAVIVRGAPANYNPTMRSRYFVQP